MRYKVTVEIETPDNLPVERVSKLINDVLQSGWADAADTADDEDFESEDAEEVSRMVISDPVAILEQE